MERGVCDKERRHKKACEIQFHRLFTNYGFADGFFNQKSTSVS